MSECRCGHAEERHDDLDVPSMSFAADSPCEVPSCDCGSFEEVTE